MVGQQPLWWQSGVVYQVYPRSFQDASGDGVGDLRGVTERLDYLAWLGIDAVWLSPFYPSPNADFGYDVSNYVDVDPLFGTLSDFDEMVTRAHAFGLRVVIDFVPNHSSDQHPWFIESRSSRDNPKRDWYFWRDPKADGSPPNNWLAAFGGSAWTLDDTTGQYYLHSFLPEQPDLNWRNPDVKAAMLDAMRFWLERGVDGFRLDVAHAFMKDPALRDNPLNPDFAPGGMGYFKDLGDYLKQIHVNDKNHPDIHPVYREIRALFDSYNAVAPRAMIGEIHEFDLVSWAKFYGEALDEIHLPFNFGLLKTIWTPAGLRQHVAEIEAAVPAGGWPNYVLGNHDEWRVASRIGPEHARVAMMLLLTLRGTPTMYYGDEIGMENVPIPPEREMDPWGLRVPGLGLGRDPERTPMQWSSGPNAGFAADGVETWLPLEDVFTTRNVDAQRGDPASMLSFTRGLLALRRAHAALSIGSYAALDTANDAIFAFERQAGAERFGIALNLTNGDAVLAPALFRGARFVASTGMDREGEVPHGTLTLWAHEGVIVRF